MTHREIEELLTSRYKKEHIKSVLENKASNVNTKIMQNYYSFLKSLEFYGYENNISFYSSSYFKEVSKYNMSKIRILSLIVFYKDDLNNTRKAYNSIYHGIRKDYFAINYKKIFADFLVYFDKPCNNYFLKEQNKEDVKNSNYVYNAEKNTSYVENSDISTSGEHEYEYEYDVGEAIFEPYSQNETYAYHNEDNNENIAEYNEVHNDEIQLEIQSEILEKIGTVELKPFTIPHQETLQKRRSKIKEIHEERVYFEVKELNKNLEKEGYLIDKTNNDYMTMHYRNLCLVNIVARDEIKEYASELYDYLIANNKPISKYGFARIYDINEVFSPFYYLSKEYKDFMLSKDMKDKEYFEIILEYKKGTATRNYLDVFLKDFKSEKLNEGFSDEEFEAIVDYALSNWSLELEDIEIFAPDMQFIKSENSKIDIFFEEHEKIYMPLSKWVEHEITNNIEVDTKTYSCKKHMKETIRKLLKTNKDEVKDLSEKLKDLNTSEDFKKAWVLNIFKVDLSLYDNSFKEALDLVCGILDGLYESIHHLGYKTYKNNKNYNDLFTSYGHWIFEHNKKILESKKEAIKESFETFQKYIVKS